MFRTVFILQVLQNGLLVLGSIECLVLRINIHSLVPLPKQLQCPETIDDMCRYEKHTRRPSHFSVIFGHLLLSYLHSEGEIFLPSGHRLSKSLHDAINMIEHVILHSENVMQCNCIPY
jgi:hypothetical protein